MANSSKYDVLLELYRKVISDVSLAADFEGEKKLEARKRLLEKSRFLSHLNYETTRSLSELNMDELQSELDCRNIKLENFSNKVKEVYNNSIRLIIIFGTLESIGVSIDSISQNISLLSLGTKKVLGDELVVDGIAAVSGKDLTEEQIIEVNSAYLIDMAKGNISPSQQKMLDESHERFMAENVNPFVTSKKLNEEDVVRLMSLTK